MIKNNLQVVADFLGVFGRRVSNAVAVLNSKTYALTATDCTNAVWVTDPIFELGNYNCVK